MKKKTALILLFAVLILLVAVLVIQVVQEGGITDRILIRAVLPIVVNIGAIVKVLQDKGRPSGAVYEQEYKDIIRNSFETQPELRKQLLDGIALYNADKLEAAVKKLKNLYGSCRTANEHCAVLTFLALSYTDMGLVDSAIDCYRTHLAHDLSRSRIWSNLGLLYGQKGQHNDALACLHEALRLDPQNAWACSNVSLTKYRLGDYQAALAFAEKALALNPSLHQAATNACCAACALGMEEECQKYYKLSIANGGNGKNLLQAIENIKKGNIRVERLMPYTTQMREAIRDFYCRTARPFAYCYIHYEGNRSRFGGPALGQPPLDSQGKPMGLLAALYLSEVHGLPDLPKKGLLQFYIADKEGLGLDRDNPNIQKDFRVLYTEDENLPEAEDTPHSASFPVRSRLHVRYVPEVEPMCSRDYRFPAHMDEVLRAHDCEPLLEQMDSVQNAIFQEHDFEGHRLLGTPRFFQHDPRKDRPDLQKYDTLLLQIDNHQFHREEEDYVVIGNQGVLNFHINGEALRRGDFSDILYWWDEEA